MSKFKIVLEVDTFGKYSKDGVKRVLERSIINSEWFSDIKVNEVEELE